MKITKIIWWHLENVERTLWETQKTKSRKNPSKILLDKIDHSSAHLALKHFHLFTATSQIGLRLGSFSYKQLGSEQLNAHKVAPARRPKGERKRAREIRRATIERYRNRNAIGRARAGIDMHSTVARKWVFGRVPLCSLSFSLHSHVRSLFLTPSLYCTELTFFFFDFFFWKILLKLFEVHFTDTNLL